MMHGHTNTKFKWQHL